MSRLVQHPAYLAIEDQLDAIGQKYRVQRVARGAMFFVAFGIVTTFVAVVLAHMIGVASDGRSRWVTVVLGCWGAWLAGSGFVWFVRPLLLRPKALEMARLVEGRVAGLHNGLTNTLLLAGRDDLQTSPWLPAIFDEILGAARAKPIDGAVRFADLRPLAARLACVVLPVLAAACVPPMPRLLGHGWQQLFSPTRFVPRLGSVGSVDVQPGDVTLVAGQPLEITVVARGFDGAAPPNAKLVFEGAGPSGAEVVGTIGTDDADHLDAAGRPQSVLRYGYRLDHVEQPLRYRAEVGGTQSDWFAVRLVRQVKLTELAIDVTPPAYTNQPPRHVVLTPADLEKTPLVVPQGSRVELAAAVDVPARAGMLQVNDAAPVPALVTQGGQRFQASLLVTDDATASILLTEGAGQVVARVPEQGLSIRCTKDAAPQIEMRWPTQDTAVAPDAPVTVRALLKDDYGVAGAEVLVSTGAADQPMQPVHVERFAPAGAAAELAFALELTPEQRKHGNAVRVQVTATDNRDLRAALRAQGKSEAVADVDGGGQTVRSSVYEIRFRDPQQIAKEQKEKGDRLREALAAMLKQQHALADQAVGFKPGNVELMAGVNRGQGELRSTMQTVAQTYEFDAESKVIQKTLLVLYANHAREAVEISARVPGEPVEREQAKLNGELRTAQRRIISTLESLLALLNAPPDPATRPATRESGQLPSKKEQLEKLQEALKQFEKEEQRILDQAASLAKKPVDNFTDADKKLLEDLKQAQDKMDAFMEQALSDFSKNSEQDMSNGSLLKDLMSVYSEVTMAKDALHQKAAEVAVAAEEMGQGIENAKSLESNIEKWLPNAPDRTKWTQEDPLAKHDLAMPELPKELEDMVGELMEQQEDLSEEMEDANANYADSMDKGIGWDAADGPIADMSAKGVTGNQLPNNNEMNGRSGEGRQGKSQGEFVGDTAQGKGGRNTPTRLDPTAFEKGQVKDESKDPTGGASGGGKLSGQGGQGLEGPVPPKMKVEMQRLAAKQAQLRNNAERLNLQYQLGRYDNFKLLDSIAMMRRVESDLAANRYVSAMRSRDVLLDKLDASHSLLAGQMHVKQDTTPGGNAKLDQEINDAMKGQLPAAWSGALKEYYKKLAAE